MNSYDKFIEKYKDQEFEAGIYTERHHIIPKHIGGTNNESNMIRLTYRQHILAHLLLYRVFRRIEDLTSYRLMRGLELDRKVAISKMIGEKHKLSGHIYELGRKNVESGFFASIRTKETCSAGGKIGGAIAKATGQIYTIRTHESSVLGGKVGGAIARENGQIQQLGKYKGTYVLIDPNGVEYQHMFLMVDALGINKDKLQDWCCMGRKGFSRRPKTQAELDARWKTNEHSLTSCVE